MCFLPGCGANDNCFSDTWAFDFNSLRWQMVNVTPPMDVDAETDEMPTMMMNTTSVSIQSVNISSVNESDLMTNMTNITELMADNETLGDYFPSARRNMAGGIYPGTTLLWLSMGVSEDRRRRFSDTWVLNISIANLTGVCVVCVRCACVCEVCMCVVCSVCVHVCSV